MDGKIGQRVKTLREGLNLGQKELGHKVGRTEGWVSKLEKGLIKKPRGNVVALLAQELDVSEGYLTDGAARLAPTMASAGDSDPPVTPETVALAEIGRGVLQLVQGRANLTGRASVRASATVSRLVPVVNGLSASQLSAGIRQVEQTIEVPVWLLNGAQDPVAYIINGDCLHLNWGIRSGDTLIVDAGNKEPRDGQVVAARINDTDETAKEFHRVPGGIDLRPTSPGYDTIPIRGNDQLVIIGVYVTHLPTGKR